MNIISDYSEIEECLKKIYLFEIVQDVMKSIANIDVVEQKPDETTPINHDESKYSEYQVSGYVLLSGDHNLLVILSMYVPCAKKVISSMLGSSLSDIDDESLLDGTMEITNIISGKIKSLFNQMKLTYKVSPPFVLYGENYGIFLKKNQKNIITKYKSGANEFNLKILFL